MKGRTSRLTRAMLLAAVAVIPLTGCVDEAMGPSATSPANNEAAPAVHGKVFERLNEINVFDPTDDGRETDSDSTQTGTMEPTGGSGTMEPTGGSGNGKPSKG